MLTRHMSLWGSLRRVLEPSRDREPSIAGAYWCDDCSVRQPVTVDELEDDRDCPSCGQSMRLERSMGDGCAC